MIELLNEHLNTAGVPVILDYTKIRSEYARISVYEQHIAHALADALRQEASSEEQLHLWYQKLIGDSEPEYPETALVDKLLTVEKTGSVKIAPDLTLTMTQARQLILQIGGIPCYQCRIDGNALQQPSMSAASLADHLLKKGICAIEFIPQWSDAETLRSFMNYFHKKHFCVSIGTGHFTTLSRTTIPVTRDGKPLDSTLLSIGYEGACIFAAHQEHRIRKQPGFLDENGARIIAMEKLPAFIAEGDAIIRKSLSCR